MKFSEDYAIGTNVIRAFSGTGNNVDSNANNNASIDINNLTYSSSLIVGNNILIDNWGVQHIDDMNPENWQLILSHHPEVILIGTGKSLIFPPPSSYAQAIKMGIGVEFMDSSAACRTYNVLVSEDRSVIAGIIL